MHQVKLVSVTPDAERLISYCARVSNPANQDNPNAEGLIRYCIKHGHWSVFEMAHVVMEINTTRSIAAQILRHRSFSFQEFSQRYCDVSALELKPQVPALRRQDTKNRQNSIDDLEVDTIVQYELEIANLFDQSSKLYHELLEAGVARECAREVLPLATPTRLYMAGSVRSWIHYIDLRQANGTQLEHQQIARSILEIFKENLPCVYQAAFGEAS
jgi:thymidylate synthase (FAD)